MGGCAPSFWPEDEANTALAVIPSPVGDNGTASAAGISDKEDRDDDDDEDDDDEDDDDEEEEEEDVDEPSVGSNTEDEDEEEDLATIFAVDDEILVSAWLWWLSVALRSLDSHGHGHGHWLWFRPQEDIAFLDGYRDSCNLPEENSLES
ncbi:hypothetical protein CBR_g3239 [Chara braunii]|uniref:Uncharacterized protein n=1 Tax=Chara braunii TaxID=69332 RepID=A0A388KFB2_CHABU|nr:hypothetical protein CBR_g3239 [Chara braunii]|eukprot:GBG68697.1 hypothetical protein CBR_g3239 [Chara braunii]